MELFSTEFFSALLAIIVIDLVLAGDNAIVIALAARNLPPQLRRKAVVWGTVGAIAVRTLMTMLVVWLLKIPGLLAIGGVLLVWIAYRLLADNDSGDDHHPDSARGFWGAMKTIVVADALMGLDNVLAVAGAAQGSFLLVVLGLLISIPIVIWGSQLILKFVERYPVIIYVGSGVLAWTAVKMVTGEPLLKDVLARYPAAVWAAYVAVIGGVLAAGFVSNHRRISARMDGRFTEIAGTLLAAREQGGKVSVLIPVDGSANALKAVRHVIAEVRDHHPMEVHLLHVRAPFSRYVSRFIARDDQDAYHRAEAGKALEPARGLLEEAGIAYAAHIEFGERAETICRVAQRLGVDHIVIGTARKNSITRMLEDSVTSKVLELASVPIQVVVGRAVSRAERYSGTFAGICVVALSAYLVFG